MSNILTAVFSASGTTEGVGRKLADAIHSDYFEITPATPYTSADLNWTSKTSRSSVEMNDKASRPAIARKTDKMNQYDTIFIGFPIWWYTAPRIIQTFLEQYDLSGKTVIPFATSGGSGMGNISADLKASAPGANILEGRRFNASVSAEELKSWVRSYTD